MSNLFRTLTGLLLTVAAFAACDPCFGASYCDEPAVDVTGLVRIHVEGVASDFEVRLRRVEGVELADDTVITRTDSEGVFHFRVPARSEGTVLAELIFVPEPPCEHYAYGVEIPIGTTRVEDAAVFLGSWGVGPVTRPDQPTSDCPWDAPEG